MWKTIIIVRVAYGIVILASWLLHSSYWKGFPCGPYVARSWNLNVTMARFVPYFWFLFSQTFAMSLIEFSETYSIRLSMTP